MATEYVAAIFAKREVLTRALDHLSNLTDLKVYRATVVAKTKTDRTIVVDDEIRGEEAGIFGGIAGSVVGAIALGVMAYGVAGSDLLFEVGAILAGVVGGGILGFIIGRVVSLLVGTRQRNAQFDALAEKLNTEQAALVMELDFTPKLIDRLHKELDSYHPERIALLTDLIIGRARR
jgi:outer membrane lipoprotein SlyB